jgi:hypothetical protein
MSNQQEQPNFQAFHKSITEELFSIRDRVRNLVQHWPSDGAFKEIALRAVLRRHLPASVAVGSGFIVTQGSSSTQIDILIIDSRKPTLFQDGDLFIVTPDAVLGVIEVKTSLSSVPKIAEALAKLSEVERMCHHETGRDRVWSGLFIYDSNNSQLKNLIAAAGQAFQQTFRPINCISCGKNFFVRYWPEGTDVCSPIDRKVWHAYELSGVAPSYFIGNLIDSISPIDNDTASFAWFPELGGKESHRKFYLPCGETEPLIFDRY